MGLYGLKCFGICLIWWGIYGYILWEPSSGKEKIARRKAVKEVQGGVCHKKRERKIVSSWDTCIRIQRRAGVIRNRKMMSCDMYGKPDSGCARRCRMGFSQGVAVQRGGGSS
jgi:hypothetical protein